MMVVKFTLTVAIIFIIRVFNLYLNAHTSTTSLSQSDRSGLKYLRAALREIQRYRKLVIVAAIKNLHRRILIC